jgi:hypothetical protein
MGHSWTKLTKSTPKATNANPCVIRPAQPKRFYTAKTRCGHNHHGN